MDLHTKSNAEIEKLASPILDELINSGNQKNWENWSKHFHNQAQNEAHRKDVERQWAEKPALSSFKPEKEFLAVIKKNSSVLTLWKLMNETTDDEILGLLEFEVENDQLKVCRYNVT